jgi:hypothetical protein
MALNPWRQGYSCPKSNQKNWGWTIDEYLDRQLVTPQLHDETISFNNDKPSTDGV